VDEVAVFFNGKVIFKQYIPKKCKWFGVKIYKLHDVTRYTYGMKSYLQKNRQNEVQTITATHVTTRSLIRRVEGIGHKLCTDNFFFSQDLYDDIHMRGNKWCGTVRLIIRVAGVIR
jgi:hypothetical protein